MSYRDLCPRERACRDSMCVTVKGGEYWTGRIVTQPGGCICCRCYVVTYGDLIENVRRRCSTWIHFQGSFWRLGDLVGR